MLATLTQQVVQVMGAGQCVEQHSRLSCYARRYYKEKEARMKIGEKQKGKGSKRMKNG